MLVPILALLGCGDGRPPRVPVAGTVLIDGKPLTHGFVRFIPTGARPSQAELDENGQFTLTCFGGQDGAVFGEHAIVVDGSEYVSEEARRWHAPRKYADPRTSGLHETIDHATNSLIVKLTWSGGEPFIETQEGAKDVRANRRKNK